MKLPETPVIPGREVEALRKHILKVRNRAVLDHMQQLVGEFERDELAKRKIAKFIVIALFAVIGTVVILFLIAKLYSETLRV